MDWTPLTEEGAVLSLYPRDFGDGSSAPARPFGRRNEKRNKTRNWKRPITRPSRNEPIRIAFFDILAQLRHSIRRAAEYMAYLKNGSKLDRHLVPKPKSSHQPKAVNPSRRSKSSRKYKSKYKHKSNRKATRLAQTPSKGVGGPSPRPSK
ncbi:hypothetical protein EsH8_XI_000002 [Colletotrichum jinshuiense]